VVAALVLGCLGLATPSLFGYRFLFGSTTRWPDGSIVMRLQMGAWGNREAKKALAKINQALSGSGVQFTSRTSSGTPRRNGKNEAAFGSIWYGRSFNASTLAIAPTWRSGRRIVEADVIFNTAWTWESYRGGRRPGRVDIRRVAIHEFGHSVGLGHETRRRAIMAPYISDIDRLQADDKNGIARLYGGGGADAEIDDARLPSSGTYTIEATARGRSHLGKYYIEVTE
jgi:hypothetical protein